MRLKPCRALLAAAALGGCTTAIDTFGDPYVAPGKFQFLRCEDLAKQVATAQARSQELHALMDRASAGTGGTAVNFFVYQPDLQGVEADLRLLRRTAEDKKCPADVIKATPKTDISPLH